MIEALYIAESGLAAQQSRLDAISNNIANLNTSGFKKATVEFSALMMPDGQSAAGVLAQDGNGAGVDGLILNGVAVGRHSIEHSQGVLKVSTNRLDVAILGDGFFEVEAGDNKMALSRGGRLSVDDEGYLAVASGHRLASLINLPPGSQDIAIDAFGRVEVRLDTGEILEIGQLELVTPRSAEMLRPTGEGLYEVSNPEELTRSYPGELGLGEIRQGYVEQSNVALNEEMIDMIVAQRGYQLNARVVQLADQLLETINNLRR